MPFVIVIASHVNSYVTTFSHYTSNQPINQPVTHSLEPHMDYNIFIIIIVHLSWSYRLHLHKVMVNTPQNQVQSERCHVDLGPLGGSSDQNRNET